MTPSYIRRRTYALLNVLTPLNYDCIELIVKKEVELLDDYIYDNIDAENLSKIGAMLIYYNENDNEQLEYYDFDLNYFVETDFEFLRLKNGFVLDTEGDKIVIDNDEYIILEQDDALDKARERLGNYFEEEIENSNLSPFLCSRIDTSGAIQDAIDIDGVSHALGYYEVDYIECGDDYYYIFKE